MLRIAADYDRLGREGRTTRKGLTPPPKGLIASGLS
jgi:hypothetical protein